MPRIDLRGFASRVSRFHVKSVYAAMLMVVVGGLVVPALVASYFLLVVQERRNTVVELNETLQRNAEILALGMQESLWNMNTEAARTLVDSVMRDPSVVRIQVRGLSDTGFIDARAPERARGNVLRAERRIMMENERIGDVTIEMDDLRSQRDLRNKQRNYALVLAVQVTVSLLLILAFLRKRLHAPLRTLAGFSDRLSRGDFDTPLVLDVPGELGRLGTQMEAMRVAIRGLFVDVKDNEMRIQALLAEQGAILDNVMFGVVFTRERRIVSVNRRTEQLFGYPDGSLVGRPASVLFVNDGEHAKAKGEFFPEFSSPFARGDDASHERQFRRRDGSLLWCLVSGSPIDPGRPEAGNVWVFADISERKENEEKLRLSATVIEQIADGVMVVDMAGTIVAVNPAFTHITGYEADAVVGESWSVTRSSRNDQDMYLAMWRQLSETGFWRGELWNTRKDGDTYLEWLTVSTVRDDAGKVTHYVGVFSDITRLKESQEKLDYLAHHDPLTSLPNRLLFNDRLLHAIGRATRVNDQLAVMFIDLDRFKNVNDTLGHHVGDELLKQVAQALGKRLREADTLARLGGDEFIVLLEDVDGSYGAGQVASKMMALFEQPFMVAEHELFVTGSIGISLFPANGQDANLLVRNADLAMYQAKSRGRNGYQFYSPEMDGEGVERLRVEALLRRAIERKEIFVHYQPQVDIQSLQLIGVEALVRWHNPELGLVSPVRFIPMAEDTGFINQIGEWVLFEACRQMRRWDEAGLKVPKVAVNLSVRQVERGAMTVLVAQVLEETGLAPRRLQLEVTESVIMNTGDALAFVHELHAIGVGLAIDDFGTGYSSLAYLKQLPVDVLKIDRSFIKDIAVDSNDEAIAIAIIQLGKSMNLSVIAEGVENEEQAAFLLRHGCTRAQGYLYGRPVAPEVLLEEWGNRNNERHEHAGRSSEA
jgi:diguanylate cyclase (GGDEF)-like protein/PAS domain S-box-containing protein